MYRPHATWGAALLFLTAPVAAQLHTHGSMVGTVTHNSAIVWTRASTPCDMVVLYGTDPTLANARQSTAQPTDSGRDETVRVAISGLTSNTRYYYATRLQPRGGGNSETGRISTFRTPPAPTQDDKVSFVVTGDIFHHYQFDVFDQMRQEGTDFFLSLGDMPYADPAFTQADYYQRHRDIRNNQKWFDFISTLAVEPTWDDHEVINDWDGASSNQLVRFGTKAFLDYYPLPLGKTEIYRSLRWGKTLEVFILDCRSKRDPHRTPSLPSKTMLGAQQKAWLKTALRASDARFKIIASSVPFRWGKASMDDWDGYIYERREILDFITDNQIRNVAIVTADNHLCSVHQHREGIREYLCGPGAQRFNPAVPDDPEVRFRASLRNYLEVRIDPSVTPAKITFRYVDPDSGKVYEDSWLDQERASARFTTDEPTGGVHLTGPYFLRNSGNDIRMPSIEPGRYVVSFDPKRDRKHVPANITVDIPPGSEVAIGGNWKEFPGSRVLMSEHFDLPLTNKTVVDEPRAVDGPSSWVVDGGVLRQASDIGGPVGGTDSDRPGTMLVLGDATWTDYTASTRMKSMARGRFGMVFRYQDPNNYYRFFMDSARAVRRLEKKVNGVYTTLAEELIPYLPYSFMDVSCVANGNELKVLLDGVEILRATDSSFSSGRTGFYVWKILLSEFEYLVVEEGDTSAPFANVVMSDSFNGPRMTGWRAVDHARNSGPSDWTQTASVMFQLSAIGDRNPALPEADLGTVLLSDAAVPNDMQFSVSASNATEGAMGIVFRYTDPDNHYRVVMNRKDRFRRIQKVTNGKWTTLWSDRRDFNYTQWYDIRVISVGDHHRVFIDDELLADFFDPAHPTGTVGLYAWRSNNVLFDNALVQTPLAELPVLVGVSKDRQTYLHARAPKGANGIYVLALALSKSPPIPVSWINPGDKRFIQLAPDPLFMLSLRSNPMWIGLKGRLGPTGRTTALISWPNLPGLKGTTIYSGGFTGDLSQNPLDQIIPTIELIFP